MEMAKGRKDGRRDEEAGPEIIGEFDIVWEAEAVNLTVVIVYSTLVFECVVELLAY